MSMLYSCHEDIEQFMTLLANLNTFEASRRGNLVWFGELDWVPTSYIYSWFIINFP